ncbi:MAG: hypothetical protein OEW08_08410 [Gammaproteobacteria bacterium]|nr:hypothetical protein [Gammaproteobacteria bacterium]
MILERFVVIVAFSAFVTACASIPSELENVGAKLLTKCSDEATFENSSGSALLVSIESDAMVNSWYLEITKNESENKYLVFLEPRKFALPSRQFFNTYRLPARMYCYRIDNGYYRITKAHGFLTTIRTSNGIQSSSTEYREYPVSYSFAVLPGKVTYIGRIISEDPEFAGRGYFGHMGAMMKKGIIGLFTGSLMPDIIVFRRVDSYIEDKFWLDGEYKTLRNIETTPLQNGS